MDVIQIIHYEARMKVTILKSFKFAKVEYKQGQVAPSKRHPTIPFNEIQLGVLKDMGNISITEEVKVAVKASNTEAVKAKTEK